MIDPNILLASRPIQIEQPLDAAQQAQQVVNLRNVGALQRGQIAMQPGELQLQQGQIAMQPLQQTALSQENQMRQVQLDQNRMINATIGRHIATDQNGKPYIDHQGVVSDLASQPGGGSAALIYGQHATAYQKSIAEMQEAQDKVKNEHIANYSAGAGSVLAAPPEARPWAYHAWLESQKANGTMQPGEWQPDYDKSLDGRLLSASKLGISATAQSEQQIQQAMEKLRARMEDTRAQREQDWRDMVEQRAQHQAEQDRIAWARVGILSDREGRLSAPGAQAQAKGFEKQYTDAAQAERDADSMRLLIGNQIKTGDFYIGDDGKPQPWEKVIPREKDEDRSDYDARINASKPKFVKDMQTRLGYWTDQANAATARKNGAMLQMDPNIANDPGFVTNEAAAAARGGKATTPTPPAAAPVTQATKAQPAQPQARMAQEGQIVRNAQGVRLQLQKGKWVTLPPAGATQ
jgi:hypothetical protein